MLSFDSSWWKQFYDQSVRFENGVFALLGRIFRFIEGVEQYLETISIKLQSLDRDMPYIDFAIFRINTEKKLASNYVRHSQIGFLAVYLSFLQLRQLRSLSPLLL